MSGKYNKAMSFLSSIENLEHLHRSVGLSFGVLNRNFNTGPVFIFLPSSQLASSRMATAPDPSPLLAELSRTLDEQPENLYAGSSDIQNAALQAAKFIFDLCKFKLVSVTKVFNENPNISF